MAETVENTPLDDVLHEPEAPKEPVEPPKEPYKSAKQDHRDKEADAKGLTRDPNTGQYLPKEPKETPKEPVKAETPKEPVKEAKTPEKPLEEYSARERAAFAKAADETRKRQALERQIEELNKKQAEKPFFEDPEGALARQRQELESKLNFATLSTKVQTSESIARSRHADYDEKFAVFSQMVQEAPHLAEQAFSSPDPAEFAYKTAKMQKDLQDAGGIDELRSKVEAELKARIRSELEAEMKKREDEIKAQKEALPGSLTDVPSKGSNRPVWGGPTPLDDILKE
jgi:hypothetical protein